MFDHGLIEAIFSRKKGVDSCYDWGRWLEVAGVAIAKGEVAGKGPE